ncbi:uncharacterized protein RCC_04159 [Ramularia collo-cygni]|uniref:Uncharacterized protein n=1 Tax=Ramularia collo-cygni TaxID=112498 RepID=A0A2D3UVU0_9PEZI|nr:uncharacterized protein RCC_04159 [Ramularia collo-cygni]CZT18315.1 uncharacterized protein RCC_04159 [Ramularia collo-cygni]
MTNEIYSRVEIERLDGVQSRSGAAFQSSRVPIKVNKSNYKPVALRLSSLLVLFAFTISLIGLLQYALVQLPNIQGRFGIDTLKDAKASIESEIYRRQAWHETGSLVRESQEKRGSMSPDTKDSTGTPLALSLSISMPPTRSEDDYSPNERSLNLAEKVAAVFDEQRTEAMRHVEVREETTAAPTAATTSSDELVAETRSAQETELTSISTASSSYVAPEPTIPPVGAPPPGVYVPEEETKGVVVFRWTPVQVFVGTYLAVLLAVFYRMIVAIVQTQLRLIDPFRQLASSKGALASSALFTSYHAQAVLGPLVALRSGRYTLFAIGVACWTSCLLPAFASEAVFVDTNWDCPDPEVGTRNACPPRITASLSVIRLLQGLLSFVAAVILGSIFALRRKTGLDEDPSSIAAVAKLMGNPQFEDDLKVLPSEPGTTLASMRQEIGHKKYKLGTWIDRSNEQHYGMIPASTADRDFEGDAAHPAHQSTTVDWSSTAARYRPVDPRSSAYKYVGHEKRWRYADFVLLLLVTGAFGVVLAYRFATGDKGFNKFFSSSTFGPRFILTGTATVIANIWGGVEQNSMVMAPFNQLANGPASFDTLSFSPTITPILSTWRAMSRGYWFAGAVTIMTLLAEVLSIAISGVPFATGQTWMNFLVVTYISLAILGVMILTAIAVISHRKCEPKIPVVPDTLGVKMSYLVGSRMLVNFDGNAGVAGENWLRSGRYKFESVVEKDGSHWWRIDQIARRGGD